MLPEYGIGIGIGARLGGLTAAGIGVTNPIETFPVSGGSPKSSKNGTVPNVNGIVCTKFLNSPLNFAST